MRHFDDIEAYLQRQMSTEEQAAFVQKLQVDDSLREELEAYEASVRLLELLGSEQLEVAKSQPLRKQRWWAMAAGIIFLVLAGLLLYANLQYSSSFLVNDQYTPPIISSLVRGENNNAETAEAIKAYADKNYQQVINLLNKQAPPSNHYLLGHAFFQLKDFENAINQFQQEKLQTENAPTYGADWYLALSYLGNNNMEEAQAILQQIVARPQDPNQDKARTLLKNLNSPWRKLVF